MYVLIILVMILSIPAYAAENLDTLCQENDHKKKSNASVGADYVPNIDIHGNSVVPADLTSITATKNPIVIPIELDIAERYGIILPSGVEMDARIADIKIFHDGRIEYNGTDISTNIEKLCQDHRQEKNNPVLSNNTNIEDKSTSKDSAPDTIEGQYP